MLWKQDARIVFTLLYQHIIPLDCLHFTPPDSGVQDNGGSGVVRVGEG